MLPDFYTQKAFNTEVERDVWKAQILADLNRQKSFGHTNRTTLNIFQQIRT